MLFFKQSADHSTSSMKQMIAEDQAHYTKDHTAQISFPSVLFIQAQKSRTLCQNVMLLLNKAEIQRELLTLIDCNLPFILLLVN